MSEDLGHKLEKTELTQLGSVKKVTVTKDDTIMLHGGGEGGRDRGKGTTPRQGTLAVLLCFAPASKGKGTTIRQGSHAAIKARGLCVANNATIEL